MTHRTATVLATAAIAIGSLLAAPPASAHEQHGYSHGAGHGRGNGYGHGHVYGYGPAHGYGPRGAAVVAPAPFAVVPRTIGHGYATAYRPYYAGTVWYGPHRHAHVMYRFPVGTPGGVVFRVGTYCGDALFAPPVYPAPGYVVERPGVSGFVGVAGPNFTLGFGF